MGMQGEKTPGNDKRGADELAELFVDCPGAIERWYGQSCAARWGISRETFAEGLKRCAAAKFRGVGGSVSVAELESYLGTLHLEDLGLALACAEGAAEAWEYFFAVYRGYLRACAGAMLKRSATSPEAQELADSLYADLYGLTAEKRGAKSLLRYFHGRSSLKTWLRAVLAQRHVDAIRAGRMFEELDGQGDGADGDRRMDGGGSVMAMGREGMDAGLGDPHREKYLLLFRQALDLALKNVEAQDALRLRMYYAEEKKLAEIGRTLGEHESSVSRHLEKVRRELRAAVEGILRGGKSGTAAALSDAEMELCFEYAAEDAPIDLDKLFSPSETPERKPDTQDR